MTLTITSGPRFGRFDIVGWKDCECGCGDKIYLKGWHYENVGIVPKCKTGHYKHNQFKEGNKISPGNGVSYSNGYVFIVSPNHPNKNANGYVRRSRLVVEEHIDRYLCRGEVIHHINGVKTDDRFENLEITNNSEHMRMHQGELAKYMVHGPDGRFVGRIPV